MHITNQCPPTCPSHHYYHHIYHHNNCTPAKVQVFFSSFHAKSAMCMHCCCLLFWTFARIKCIHHRHHHSHHHSCKGNILKGSLMYQHWQIRKRPLPPHNPQYSFHPPLQKINHHSFENAMRNPNFQFDIFNIPFVEKPLPPQSRTVHPPSQYISRGIFEGPSYWRWHMLLLAFSDDPHRTVLRQLPPPSFPY